MRGSIQKRTSGYSIVVDAGKDHRGKRKQIRRSGFRTKKEAEAKITEILNQINEGKQLYSSKVGIVDLLKKWDEVHLAHLKESTQNSYRAGYKRFIKYLKEEQLENIKPYHIQEAYHELAKGYSAHGYNQSYTAMKSFFDFAIENEFIKTNPHRVKMKRTPKNDIQIWDRKEIQAFLDVAKEYPPLYTMYYLALHTGMRAGEIRGLKWSDIDMTNKLIEVKYSLHQNAMDFDMRKETKTDSSRRTIYISDSLVEVLKEYKKKSWVANIHNGVFATRNGKSIHTVFIRNKMDHFCEKAGVTRIRFHDLRHTHASLLIQEGVNVKIVSERLGHSDVAITLNTYTHFDDDSRREAAEIFDSVTKAVTN
ncbi:site-specific integrase [Sediminibacillus massiliensis]|uniref:site-specific integrase n=1 Tax=Sediminibacillus massiliensis TaxID=1926277 RepID=UPI0015C3C93C|nr:site-specific integrase [Sediminibacillus massiliensis]